MIDRGLSESEQQRFVDSVVEAASAAERAAGSIPGVTVNAAGVSIRLSFAGWALHRMLVPALQHIVTDGNDVPAATLHIWDSESTGVRIPPAPVPPDHFAYRGDVWGFTSERYRVAFHFGEFSVSVFDMEAGVGSFWVRRADELPYWTRAAPLRTLLHWCLSRAGIQLLHAAAVGDERGAILITGRGGTGKSTTALRAILNGMTYVADDYLAVSLAPQPMVHSLYSTAKVDAESMRRFADLEPCVLLPANTHEKAVLNLFPHRSTQLRSSLPLRAVVTPRIVNTTETTIEPVDRIQLLQSATFTTLSQLPYAGRDVDRLVHAVLERVPGFEIRLGSDPSAITPALQRLLAQSDSRLWEMSQTASHRPAASAMPLISVIIPIFNAAHFLHKAVASVLAQECQQLEIIVVDDGSTDDIDAAVTALPIAVRVVKQPNAGPAAARNTGIRAASGEFIAFLDVDDEWPDRTLDALSAMLVADPSLMLIQGFSQVMVLDTTTGRYEAQGNPADAFPYYIGSALYRREVFDRVGPFDPTLRFGEDWDWFLRFRDSGLPAGRMSRVTLQVHRHGANMTAERTDLEMTATVLPVFKRMLDRKRRSPQTPGASS